MENEIIIWVAKCIIVSEPYVAVQLICYNNVTKY